MVAVETSPDTATTASAEPAADASSRPVDDRRLAIARSLVAILARTLSDGSRLAIELNGDAQLLPPSPGHARIRIRDADAVGRLLLPPGPDVFAEGYLRGDLEIDGDVGAAIDAAATLDLRRLRPRDLRRLVRYGYELRRGTPEVPPLRRVAHVAGRRHSRARDLAAVRFHYDVGESFYSLWLDRRLTYSCAYFAEPLDPAADLDAAQEAKLDLICRKLRLESGRRLLDIGCGWGSLILFAAERYGVEAVGVTLSERQAAEANRRAAKAGLTDRARAIVRDYRDLAPLGTFDAVASVGMFEHVGVANLRKYFDAAYRAVRPGVSSSTTASRPPSSRPVQASGGAIHGSSSGMSFRMASWSPSSAPSRSRATRPASS